MFLNKPFAILRRVRDDDAGAALAAVIGLVVVGMLLSTTIMSTVVSGLGHTTATRAAVQSEASAKSGLAVAVAALQSSAPCTASYLSAAAPAYTASLSYTTDSAVTGATAWIAGCPVATAQFVKITSVGTAVAKGVAGNTSGNLRKVEAIYGYVPPTAAIRASGSAIYTYSSPIVNQASILTDGAKPASIAIRTGSVDCTTMSIVQGDILAHNGDVSVQSPCSVRGSVRASGGVNIYGKVGADVSSASTSQSLIDPAARIGGAVALAGTLNSWGSRCPAPNAGWDNPGNACSAKQETGASSVRIGLTGAQAPTAPNVPDWIDYAYKTADWQTAGYTVVVWPGDADHCTIDNRTKSLSFVTALNTYTNPVVINATACSRLTLSSSANLTLSLRTDIAFISKAFNIESFTASSANSTKRELRFVVPDGVADGIPSPAGGGTVDINSGVTIGANVSALIYSPGTIKNWTVNWRGEMFGGNVQFNSNSGLIYTQIGLPGIDLDGGSVSGGTPASAGGLGTLVSLRDLTS